MSEKAYRDRLNEADRELNRRGSDGRLRKRTDFMPIENKLAKGWHEAPGLHREENNTMVGEEKNTDIETDEGDIANLQPMKKKSIGFLSVFFLFSIIFFLAAAAFAYFYFTEDTNYISLDNVNISVMGPLSIRAGEELSLELMIENKNKISLQSVDLATIFPGGTRSIGTEETNLSQTRESLEDIPANGFAKKTLKAVLYGEEGSEKEIAFALEYRVPSSNAIFVKKKIVSIILSDAPARLAVIAPQSAVSGDEIVFTITVTPNSNKVLRDVYVEAVYPPGFSFIDASLEPVFGTKLWALGDIPAGSTRSLKVKGTLEGQNEESKLFTFTTGVGKSEDGMSIAVPYIQSLERLSITNPQLGLSLLVNDSAAPTTVAEGGKIVRVDLAWSNNLPERVLDVEVSLMLSGQLLSKATVAPDSGFYNSGDDTLLLSKRDIPELALLEPGARGKTSVTFLVASPAESIGTPPRNATIQLVGNIIGRRLSDTKQASSLFTRVIAAVKVASVIQLSSRAIFSGGPFTNSGPLPPVVGKNTTYTVAWSVTNTGNDVREAEVKASLPSFMRYVGTVSPNTETLTYSEKEGQIVWNIGNLAAGTGYTSPPRSVFFQVALTPSLSQKEQEVTILSEAIVSGRDDFTGQDISSKRRELTTRLLTDPNFTIEQAVVKER